MEKSFKLKLRFSGRDVSKHGLDLYDGSSSFSGFAQALQIITHAYMTKEVVSRATALKGAKMYFGSPRQGSVLFDIVTVVEKYPVVGAFSAVVFYDFIKFTMSKAVGLVKVKPETVSVQKLMVDETFFDQLAETIEGSLQRAHRAIDSNGARQVTLERPRGELVTFNHSTSNWVNTRNENPEVEVLTGNITRYNSITGNGRAYVHELKKVIPFRLGDRFIDNKRGLLTWSLHGNTIATRNELKFWASKIEAANGEAKRLILADCVQGE